MPSNTLNSLKANVENPRGSVEKLSPTESVEGADTVLRGSVRVPKIFSEGNPEASRPRGRSPQGFAAEGFPKDYQNHEVHWRMKSVLTLPLSRV